MNLPFTAEQFLSVFEQYNTALWPIQIVLNALAAAAIVLAVWKVSSSDRMISFILAFLWFWMGLAYHIAFFSTINPAAYLFGVVYVLEGVILVLAGVVRKRLRFRVPRTSSGIVGGLFLLYALIVYPAMGAFLGHVYPKAPTFGLPCPTTIFTFGMLLWTEGRVPKILLIIPLLWSIVGFSAAVKLGMTEDVGLLVAGVAGTLLILIRERSVPGAAADHTA